MSESRMAEMECQEGGWRSECGMGYRLSFHSANVFHPLINSVATSFCNAVTTSPVHINMVEARILLPSKKMDIELAVRAQDGQPRPESGATAAVELAIRIRH